MKRSGNEIVDWLRRGEAGSALQDMAEEWVRDGMVPGMVRDFEPPPPIPKPTFGPTPKPHSLTITKGVTPKPALNAEWVARHGVYPKGTVLPETQIECCPKRRVADFPKGFIPPQFYERNLEQNQLLNSCCRHPENHKIKAKKSHPSEPRADIYIFYCQCGRKHRVFCVGMGDARPEWR